MCKYDSRLMEHASEPVLMLELRRFTMAWMQLTVEFMLLMPLTLA